MQPPFVGSRALATGAVANKHRLRTSYRAIFPDVYLPNDLVPTLRQMTEAAWLWSGRQGIVSGLAASALLGAKWVYDDTPVDLIHPNPRAPRGIVTHRDTLSPEEFERIAGMAATTAARTAFDLAAGTLETTPSPDSTRWEMRPDSTGKRCWTWSGGIRGREVSGD